MVVERKRGRPGHDLGVEELGEGRLVALDGGLEAPHGQEALDRLPQHQGRRAQGRLTVPAVAGRDGDAAPSGVGGGGRTRRGWGDVGLRRRREVIAGQA